MDRTDLVAGRRYTVRCVQADLEHRGMPRWWPVLGPMHRDAEILNIDFEHWHIDWRFVSDRRMRRLIAGLSERHERIQHENDLAAIVIDVWTTGRHDSDGRWCTPKPTDRRRRCRRERLPRWSNQSTEPTWRADLEHAYRDVKLVLREGQWICPHRGAVIASADRSTNTTIECPLHGLVWCTQTRALIPTSSDADGRSRSRVEKTAGPLG